MCCMSARPPSSPLFPYTTLFRSRCSAVTKTPTAGFATLPPMLASASPALVRISSSRSAKTPCKGDRKSTRLNLQSHSDLVCRLLLEKKNYDRNHQITERSSHQNE